MNTCGDSKRFKSIGMLAQELTGCTGYSGFLSFSDFSNEMKTLACIGHSRKFRSLLNLSNP